VPICALQILQGRGGETAQIPQRSGLRHRPAAAADPFVQDGVAKL
jgi:hypothetical protein